METLVAGSYDRFLFGLQCSTSESTEVGSRADILFSQVHACLLACLPRLT